MVTSVKIGDVPAWLATSGPEGDVVISSRLRVARNLARYKFPKIASLPERKSIYDEIMGVCQSLDLFNNFISYNFCRLPRLEQQLLVEERIASPDLLNADGERGIVSGNSHRINMMINEEDHLRMQCIDAGLVTDALWENIDSIDDAIGAKVLFAYDKDHGFLTSCPTNSGTGLRLSFLVHLPALILTKAMDQVLQASSQMGIMTRGFWGENSEVLGSFFQMSNSATLGASEVECIRLTQSIIKNVIAAERAAREKILHNAKAELEDKVYRAYGILMYAKTLSVNEFLNLSSALRLGIDCAIFDKLTIARLNRILLLMLPAHMQAFLGRNLSDDEMNRERADLIRMLLKE